jgi:hypothetical protein
MISMAQGGAGTFQKPALALGAPQGIGADHPYAVSVHGAEPLPEALEAAQGAFRGGVIQPSAIAQAGGQTHHFTQAIENDELAVRMTGHDHVKTVGS